MQVYDYVIQHNDGNMANIWQIVCVYRGALGQQDMVGLIPINREYPVDENGIVREMLTPIELVEPFVARHLLPIFLAGGGTNDAK